MKYNRFIKKKIEEALEDTPVVFINGPRQSGKSTIANALANQQPQRQKITLDDMTDLDSAKSDPKGFLQREEKLLIDEIQRAPELFLPIKQLVDENRIPGQYLLTGSADILLLPELSDSLAGRMEILTLYPLSIHEIHDNEIDLIDLLFTVSKRKFSFNKESLIKQILIGGYPEIQTRSSPERQRAWFQSYLTTLLQRDLRDLAKIEGLTKLPNLLKLLGARCGGLLNINELSRTTQIPGSTLKRYLTLLQTIYLIYPLPAYSNNHGKRLVKSPKIYLTDTGLLSHLLGLNMDGFMQEPQLWGKMVETFVFNELLKHLTWSKHYASLYHYRSLNGQKVDFVIEKDDGKLIGIEVKASHSVSSNDFKGLKQLALDSNKTFVHGYVFYMGKQIIPFGEHFTALPIPSK